MQILKNDNLLLCIFITFNCLNCFAYLIDYENVFIIN